LIKYLRKYFIRNKSPHEHNCSYDNIKSSRVRELLDHSCKIIKSPKFGGEVAFRIEIQDIKICKYGFEANTYVIKLS